MFRDFLAELVSSREKIKEARALMGEEAIEAKKRIMEETDLFAERMEEAQEEWLKFVKAHPSLGEIIRSTGFEPDETPPLDFIQGFVLQGFIQE